MLTTAEIHNYCMALLGHEHMASGGPGFKPEKYIENIEIWNVSFLMVFTNYVQISVQGSKITPYQCGLGLKHRNT